MSQPELLCRRPGVVAFALPHFDAHPSPLIRFSFMSLLSPDITAPRSCLSKGVSGHCPTRRRNSRHQTLSVPRAELSSAITSMSWPHSNEAVRAIIHDAVPHVVIESVKPMSFPRLQRGLAVKVNDGRSLMLVLPPSPRLRLLRCEQWLVLSEALVVKFIFRKVLEHAPKDAKTTTRNSVDVSAQADNTLRLERNKIEYALPMSSDQLLLHYMPAFIASSPSNPELGSAFNIFEPIRGTPISNLPDPLTNYERKMTDFEKGQLIRRISEFKAPNSKFGPAVAVIGNPPLSKQHSATPSIVGSGGVETWTKAFLSMNESILRDGEDLAVMMSYSRIRDNMQRLSHLLDAVTQSRLVNLDAGNDSNVFVARNTAGKTNKKDTNLPELVLHATTAHHDEGKAKAESTSDSDNSSDFEEDDNTTVVNVTGLRDWSNCVFGDPLLASIFSQSPSAEFLAGFRRPPCPAPEIAISPERPTQKPSPPEISQHDLVEDRENAPIRLLMYECYHATVCVIKQFYRPGGDSTKKEMAARRRLAAVLNRLDDVDETAGKRPRRESGFSAETWPVKKPRSERNTPAPE